LVLREFASWWARQMLALVPARLVPDAGRADALLVILQDAPDSPLTLSLRRRQRESLIGRFSHDEPGLRAAAAALRQQPRAIRRHVVLRLAGRALLARDVTLPLAAERDVSRVLSYEMDRLTPFTAEEVFWKASVMRRDRARGRMELRLLLVPKAALAPVMAALARIGGAPTAIEAASDGSLADATQRIDLMPEAASRNRSRILALTAGLAGALALAALVIPFVAQSRARARVERDIAALQPQVAEVTALRRRLAAGAAGADIVAAERARIGDALQVLATVTDLLPDDTVLSELSLRQGRLGISGQSQAAARLIPTLAADPLIRNPSFVAPVTRALPVGLNNRGSGTPSDLFSIRAELSP
jgi:general secretion pathway protein L